MKNTILVTGATSQIGKFLLPLLVEKGYIVYAISRKKHKSSHDKVIWISADIEKKNFQFLFDKKIDTLVHLAEITMVSDVINNINSLRRVIAFSSTSLIVKKDSKNSDDRTLSAQLQKGENNLINSCHNKNIQWTIFRPTLVYGANLDQNVEFITQFIRRYHFFPVLGKGDGLRQPVHSYDLSISVIDTIECNTTFNKIYNLSGGETLKYIDMVFRIFSSLDFRPVVVRIPKALFYVAISVLKPFKRFKNLNTGMVDRLNEDLCFDSSDAKNDFGYNPHKFLPNVDMKDVI